MRLLLTLSQKSMRKRNCMMNLCVKEDKQEGKPEVNQNEHNAETVNAGDNQKETAPKDDCGKDTAEETEELFISAIENERETDSDFSRSQWQLPLKTCGMYVTYTLDTGVQANILPQHIYYYIENRPRLHKTNIKLISIQFICSNTSHSVTSRATKVLITATHSKAS